MLLTFKHNKFVLEYSGGRTASTSKIQKVLRFRKFADKKAEKIFARHTIIRRDLPPNGALQVPKGLKLFSFQEHQGVPFILSQNRTYLAHQPGLGKSAQAITAVNTAPGKTLIICPAFLKTTWEREIIKWSTTIKIIKHVPEAKEQERFNWACDYLICSDSMLIKPWVLTSLCNGGFDYCFIDEAHRFKSHDSKRSVALFGGKVSGFFSPGLVYDIKTVCALSGTPMLNRPIELWPILFALAPETIDFMSYEAFGYRYCDVVTDEMGHIRFVGSRNEEELYARIKPLMQRIRKEDVLKDLPNKIREIILVDRDPRKLEAITFDLMLSKALDNERLKVEDPAALQSLGEYARVRHEVGVAKVSYVAKFVEDLLEENPHEHILLFAHHRKVVAMLCDRLKHFGPAFIMGGMPQFQRTEIQDLFQAGKVRLLVGNIDSMNLGLTLTKATRVVFAEYAWTPALNEQAEDRAHRIGQKDSVFVQYIVMPNSIDEKILNKLLEKEAAIEKVIDGN